jgi:multidrug transporter EmrE-like cation transporter
MASTPEQHQRLVYILLLVILITLFEACGQTCLKVARNRETVTWFLVGLVLYMMVAGLLYTTYRYGGGLGHINLVWSCMSIIIAVFIGAFVFREKINYFTWVSLLFAVGAIYFAHKAAELEG